MDAAEDTREESQRLTVLPHHYGMLVRLAARLTEVL